MTDQRTPSAELNEVCALITDGTHFSPPTSAKGPFLYITSKNIRTGEIDLADVSYVDEKTHAKIYEACPVRQGDVLFVKDGVNTGMAAVNSLTEPFSMLSSVALIRPRSDRVDARYLVHWLNSPIGRRHMMRNMSGSAIRRLVLREIRRAAIPVPVISEQRWIADILDRVEALRVKRQVAMAQLDALTQSTFLDLFGNPLARKSAWTVSPLKEVCDKITDGTHSSPPVTPSGFPYITAKHVKEYGLDFESDPWFISEEDHRQIFSRCDPKPGDVLYIKDGATTGIAAINRYTHEFSMLSSLALLRPNVSHLDSTYLCFWLNNPFVRREVLGNMAGAAIRRLTLTKISAVKIPVPPVSLQQKFANFIGIVDALRYKQRTSLQQLNALLASVQYRAFRGESFAGRKEEVAAGAK